MNLDCLIIGPSEPELSREWQQASDMREHTASFAALRSNVLSLDHQPVSYLEALSRVIARQSGQHPGLRIAELPSLAVSYLHSFLAQRGLTVASVDFVEGCEHRLGQLLDESPTTAVITTTLYTEPAPIKRLAARIRAGSEQTRIIVGGPFILNICSNYPAPVIRHCLADLGVDYAVFDAQGESTLAQLVAALRDGDDPVRSVPNLCYLDNGQLATTPRQPEDNSLDDNLIDWRLFDRQRILPTVITRTARGCNFRCSFCSYPLMAGSYAAMGIPAVESELRLLQQLGVRNLAIIDDTFNIPPARFKQLCRLIAEGELGFDLFPYIRCAQIDAEGAELLARAGATAVFLGIESADPTVLANMNKAAQPAEYEAGIRILHENGIRTYVSLIVGFPGETRDSVRRTIDFVQRTAPTYFHAELYHHSRFAPVGKRAQEFGLTGSGYAWSHATMDWRQGVEALHETIGAVTDSLYLPTYCMDFWSLPYLHGRGISFKLLDAFLAAARPAVLASLGEGTSGAEVERLLSLPVSASA